MERKKKLALTDPFLKSLAKKLQDAKKSHAAAESIYDIMDTIVPGFGVRVSPKGRITFFVRARFGASKTPARRSVGVYGRVTLEQARTKARQWFELIQKGEDPARIEERERAKKRVQEQWTFKVVVEEFTRLKLAGERKGKDVQREIAKDLMSVWEKLLITEITDDDIIAVIDAKVPHGKVGARNLLALIKRFFRWVAGKRKYGLTDSPAQNLTAKNLIGADVTKSRDRILSDDELRAFWQATGEMPFPVGPAYRLLLRTALRLNEAVEMQRDEIDPLIAERLRNRKEGERAQWRDLPEDRAIWTIPAERMKGLNHGKKQARAHVVPLTGAIVDLLSGLPQLKGPFLFSTTSGARPVSFGTKVKDDLDARMLVKLQKLAESRGQDPESVTLPHFVNHDIRRTVRSHLSRLKIEEVAREAILAHARPGIKGVYDKYDYLAEKREALDLWAARLRTIVEPVPNNVVTIAPKNLTVA